MLKTQVMSEVLLLKVVLNGRAKLVRGALTNFTFAIASLER
jgi:hypothetical protein